MQKNHIVVLRDNTLTLLTQSEADKICADMAKSDFVKIPNLGKVKTYDISRVDEISAWLKSEKLRLSESGKNRCPFCFQINFNSQRCDCREKDKPMEYSGVIGSGENLMSHLAEKTKSRGDPPEKLLKEIIVGIINKHQWAKDWFQKDKTKGTKSISNYAKTMWRSNNFKKYLKANI